MIILVLVMVNQSVLQTQLSQSLATQGCAFSQSPAVWPVWSLSSDYYFLVSTSSELFIAFVVEDWLWDHVFCLGNVRALSTLLPPGIVGGLIQAMGLLSPSTTPHPQEVKPVSTA